MENSKKNPVQSKPNVTSQNAGAGDCVAVKLKNQCGLTSANDGCNSR